MHDFKVRTLAAAVSAALASGFVQAAAITVTTTADGSVPGECTLRDAIEAANTNAAVNACAAGDPGQDQIDFAAGAAGTITLTGGQFDITEPSVITGPGAPDLTIDAGAASRHFQIAAGADAAIGGVTLINGGTNVNYAPGGSIYGESDLALHGVVLTGNATHGQYSDGGAVALRNADLTVIAGEFVGNQTHGASSPGGAIAVYGGGLEMRDAHVAFNSTNGNYSPSGTMDVRGGDAEVYRSQILGGRTFGDFSRCGGLYVVSGDTLITESEIGDNRTLGDFSPGGGLILIGGNVDIFRSSINHNSADGSYGGGGAIMIDQGDARLINSTISGNSATGPGSGIHFSGYYGMLTLLHTTIADNFDSTGVGVDTVHISSLGFPTIALAAANTIITQDPASGSACNKDFDAAASANNLVTDATCGTAALIGNAPVAQADLDLGVLTNNGGPTLTHALGPASAAINAAAAIPCGDPLMGGVDQRGEPRPGTGSTACDVGAFEVQGTPPLQPQLTMNPGLVDFGQWCLNDLAPPETVTFVNSGNATLDVTSVGTASPPPFGELPAGTCPAPPFSLNAGDSCTRVYNFLPFTAGAFGETLNVVSNDPNSPHALTLEGAAEHAVIQVDPPGGVVDFGQVQIGLTASAMLEVANAGATCGFEVSGAEGLGPLPPAFTVSPGTCPPFPFLLAPGASCELEVAFTPAAPGALAHDNRLNTDATDGSDAYKLQGEGTTAAGPDSIFEDRFEQP